MHQYDTPLFISVSMLGERWYNEISLELQLAALNPMNATKAMMSKCIVNSRCWNAQSLVVVARIAWFLHVANA